MIAAANRVGADLQRCAVGAAFAVLAFLAALLGAVGPSVRHSTVVDWPSSRVTASERSGSYVPLILSAHRAAEIELQASCAVFAAPEGTTVLATAPRDVDDAGLWVGVGENASSLVLRNGSEELSRTQLTSDPTCRVSVSFDDRRWRVRVGGRAVSSGSSLDAPAVSMLRSDVRIGATQGGVPFGVRVVSAAGGSSPSGWQTALLGVAAAALLIAVTLLRSRDGPRRKQSIGLHPADVIVAIVILVWMLVGPLLYDDGWILATLRNSKVSGSYSSYFDAFGAVLPLGWAHESLLRLLVDARPTVLAMRVPAALAAGATWVAARKVLAYATGADAGGQGDGRAILTLAAHFLVFNLSWLNTFRPEPMVAALATCALLAAQRVKIDEEDSSPMPIFVAAVAATVATSLHPAGFVAWAPLLILIPALLASARRWRVAKLVRLVGMAFATLAIGTALIFADTDISSWRENRQLFIEAGHHSLGWRSELVRYQYLLGFEYGVVARRASVFFALVAVFLFITRRRRLPDPRADLPALSLLLAFVLLALTPSKWPWHFGVLAGLAAAALAIEVRRALDEGSGGDLRTSRTPYIVIATMLASSVAWQGNDDWHVFALRTVRLGTGARELLPIDLTSPAVLGCAYLVGASVLLVRRRTTRRGGSLGHWFPAASLFAIAGLTLLTFSVDVLRTRPQWTLGGDNIRSLSTRSCSWGDQVFVRIATDEPFLVTDGALTAESTPPTVPEPSGGVERLGPLTSGSIWSSQIGGDAYQGDVVSPWFHLSEARAGTRLGVYLSGGLRQPQNTLSAEYGRLASTNTAPGDVISSPVVAHHEGDDWGLYELPRRPAGMTHVRLLAKDGATAPMGWIAFSAPRPIERRSIQSVLDEQRWSVTVVPAVRAYFPCARDAPVARGIVEAPELVVADGATLSGAASPFRPIFDVFPHHRLDADFAGGEMPPGLSIFQFDLTRKRGFVEASVR